MSMFLEKRTFQPLLRDFVRLVAARVVRLYGCAHRARTEAAEIRRTSQTTLSELPFIVE